jgi:transposase-like protein
MIIDRDLTLLNAVAVVFPQYYRQLCIWHVEKNILTHASSYFPQAEAREKFIKGWASVVSSTSVNIYNKKWSSL